MAFRDLDVLSRSSSFDVREQSGSSMKSALRHIFSVDLRDERIFPTCGSLFQLTSEGAGIGGDVGFLKSDFYVQSNYSVMEDFVSFSFCFVLLLFAVVSFVGVAGYVFWGNHEGDQQ